MRSATSSANCAPCARPVTDVEVSVAVWIWSAVAFVVLVALDFVLVSRRPHDVSMREAAFMSIFYIGLALVFALGLLMTQGAGVGGQFVAAFVVEKALSVDNLFVFIVILDQFRTPAPLHQRVLLVGICLALILRTVLILAGAALISAFAFTFVVFGALLIWTGVRIYRDRNSGPHESDSRFMRWLRRHLRVAEDFDGTRLTTRVAGRRAVTPLMLVMVAIGTTDVLFALDSIPAAFGVTNVAYLVFAANAFALLGLRALYFLLRGLLDRLVYLSTGLAVILVFIGVKLILEYLHQVWPSVPEIGLGLSLGVIATVLAATVIASLRSSRRPGNSASGR